MSPTAALKVQAGEIGAFDGSGATGKDRLSALRKLHKVNAGVAFLHHAFSRALEFTRVEICAHRSANRPGGDP